MRVTFLGTSSGTPTKQRNVTAVAISLEHNREWCLIDCGEGTQHQLLHTRYSLLKLSAVFITHMHGDHCYGLPGLLASAQLSGRTEPLTLVGPPELESYLKAVARYAQLSLDFELRFIALQGEGEVWQGAGLRVSAHPLSHRVPCWGFSLLESSVERRLLVDKLRAEGIAAGPHWSVLQKGERVTLPDGRILDGQVYSRPARTARKVVVGGDNDRPELLTDACREANLLVHEATYTEEVAAKVGPAPQHSTAAAVARFAQEVGLSALILTHFSPRYQQGGRRSIPLSVLEQEAQASYRGRLFMAEDFASYEVLRSGETLRCE